MLDSSIFYFFAVSKIKLEPRFQFSLFPYSISHENSATYRQLDG